MVCWPKLILFLLAATLGMTNAAQAGVVISFNPAITQFTVPQVGTTSFTITVRVRADVGTAAVSGYDIPVDLSLPAGKGLPSGWSIAGFTKLKDFGSNLFFPGPDPLNPDEGDFLVGDASLAGPIDFGIDPVPLFSFTVDVDATAQTGAFTASVVNGALLAFPGFAANEITIENVASIQANAVPEPSGMVLLASATALLFHRRRRPS